MGRHYTLILLFTLAIETGVSCAEPDQTLAELQDLDSRIVTAGDITYYGHKISWQDHSLEELLETKQRILTTKSLARFGDIVDWQEHSLHALKDRHARVWVANEIVNYNHDVDWRKHTLAELVSMRDRIEKASWLQYWYGYRIDWRQFSLAEMVDLRRKTIAFTNSIRSGRSVAWQDVYVPPDPYADLDPEATSAAKLLSEQSGTAALRLVAMVQKSREILQNSATDVDELSLITAATVIFKKHRVPIAECLTRYITHRRNGLEHVASVDEATATGLTEREANGLAEFSNESAPGDYAVLSDPPPYPTPPQNLHDRLRQEAAALKAELLRRVLRDLADDSTINADYDILKARIDDVARRTRVELRAQKENALKTLVELGYSPTEAREATDAMTEFDELPPERDPASNSRNPQ